MTDARKALVARQRDEYGASWDALVPEVGWTLGRIIESVIEDALAAGWTPPTVKPSVEDVARALWELDEQEAETTGGARGVPWSALDSLMQSIYRADAKDILALLPGRTEAEVKAEAWDEGYKSGYRDRRLEASYEPGTNPYRQKEADRER